MKYKFKVNENVWGKTTQPRLPWRKGYIQSRCKSSLRGNVYIVFFPVSRMGEEIMEEDIVGNSE